MSTERFTNHVLEIRHDQDLYRHLYCAEPGTITHSFELITAPGNLIINGDIRQSFVFSGDENVFAIFRGACHKSKPNYDYLAQKLRSGLETAYEYQRSLMVENIQRDALAAIDSHDSEELPDLLETIENELLPNLVGHESHDWEVVRDFSYFDFDFNTFEWNVRALTKNFKYACDAITWGIGQYDQQSATVRVSA